jgi:hypothetical protein
VSDRLDASAPEVRVVVRPRYKILRAAGGKFGILLLALVALMASAPLIIEGSSWNAVLTLFTGAVMVASLHAARPGAKSVAIGLALALTDFGVGRCVVAFGARWLVLLQAVLWLSTLIYVSATILEAIFESESVTLETLQASLCVYLLLGLLAAFAFVLIDLTMPGSFQSAHGPAVVWTDDRSRAREFMQMFVFSYATLSGTSYEGIAPDSGFASNAASLEAMAGQIFLAVVIARLVGIQAAAPPAGPERRADQAVLGPIEPE